MRPHTNPRTGSPRRGRPAARRRIRALLALPALALAIVLPNTARAASVPPVPGNVAAAAASSTTIHESWSASPGATSYVVTNGNTSHTTTATSYTWTGLSLGTYMCTAVAAKNSAGQSAWSGYACVTILPPTPSNIVATGTSETNIHISWNAVPGADSYEISNGTDPPKLVFSTSYDWTVALGTYMCFDVQAIEGGTGSNWSPWACATALLPMPTGVKIVALNPTTFNVSWQPVANATAYTVSNGDTQTFGLTGTSFNWITLPNTYMCFSVSAQFNTLSSGGTAWNCGTTPAANPVFQYVNMGDSLSAGEGTLSYTTGTNTPDNQCHRSDSSYSGQYVTMSGVYSAVDNVACSGAVSSEFSNSDTPDNSMGVPDAGEQAQQFALSSNTTLVTASFGINDIDFADILNTCYGSGLINTVPAIDGCFADKLTNKDYAGNTKTLSQLIDDDEGALQRLFATIKSDSPRAAIIAVTYPQIYPATGDVTSNLYDCSVGPRGGEIITSQNQLTLLRAALNHLDDVIVQAARGAGIGYLDERNAFAGHELCTADPWENTIVVTPNGAGNDSFHPNAAGYRQYATDLKNFLGY
ncbi:MAG TPA: SGNH/GDSL hydrolase family protein [Actinocrinis sp.]|nr:SGNH/GDSL hydrolase family protein [Actinocrinis sp.]